MHSLAGTSIEQWVFNMESKNSLLRFLEAQQGVYEQALEEIRGGRKTSHWMWFIFPQIQGLGHSETARFFAIKNMEEAKAYLAHPVLGKRLVVISQELLKQQATDAVSIFGHVDSLKLNSSMTLFSLIENTNPVFQQVIDQFFSGAKDRKTLDLLHG